MSEPKEVAIEQRARAARAVKRFDVLKPALQRYARRVTGNPKLIVKAGPQSQTDGDVIEIAPPIELATRRTHQRSACGSREFGIAVCPACRSNEIMMAHLKHEIGHITHGSFIKFSWEPVRYLVKYESTLKPEYIDRFISDIPTRAEKFGCTHGVNDYMCPNSLLTHVGWINHPYLTTLMLVMEDARCDAARFREDPEEGEVFFSMVEEMIELGVTYADGSHSFYGDMEIAPQLAIGFLVAAQGHEIEGHFLDEVVEILDKPEVRTEMTNAVEAKGTVDSLKVALKVLTLFQQEGEMPDPPPSASEEDLKELLEELMEALSQVLGHGEDLTEPGEAKQAELDGEGNDGEPKEGKGKSGWGDAFGKKNKGMGAGLNPDDIRNAVDSMNWLDRVPVNVLGPKVYQGEELYKGDAYVDSYYESRFIESEEEFRSAEQHVAPALNAARLAFGVNARVERHRNQRSGRISSKTLARRVPFGDDRMFAKKVEPDKRSYHVVIGMDASGSTAGGTLRDEKRAVLAMADVCARLDIGFEIWAHTTEGGGPNVVHDAPALYEIKAASARWGITERDNLRRLCSSGANYDGHTLQFYRKRVEVSRATEKILMYYTDGAMPAGNRTEELEVLKSEIKYCNEHNITLMAVGMGVDTPAAHGFDTAVVNGPEDYRKVVDHLGKRLLR